MTKKRKKKKNILQSTFYRVYFALVLLCAVGIFAGARYLNGLLRDYESAQPVHEAASIARLFESADYDALYAFDTSAPNLAGGDKGYYVENMREISADKEVSWKEVYSENKDERRYEVLLSDKSSAPAAAEKFAEFTLVPSGETTRHGFTLWKRGEVTTFVTMNSGSDGEEAQEEVSEPEPEEVPTGIPCRITAPSESTVTVDGVTLTADDAVTTDIPTVPEGLLPPGVPNPTMNEYEFYSESGAPQISVIDKNGNPQEVSEAGEHAWACSLPENAELKAQYEGPVVDVAKKIASCAAKTIKKDGVLRYCAKNSPAYASISNFDNSTGYSKKPESFENIQTSNYYMYSEDCFSCHVSFDYLSKFTASVIKTYPTTITLYFIRQGDSGKLYSFTLY